MKKLPKILFLLVIFALSAILSLGMLFAGPSEAGANERLANKPTLMQRDGTINENYLTDWAAFINDRFFLRQELISANNKLNTAIFGVTGTEDVILGEDGWLFYGTTLDDYTGQNPMSQRELFGAANNLALIQEACAARGQTFAFVIAPNKNSLYPEYMPDLGLKAEQTDARKILALLAEMGVNTVDLYAAFGAEEEALYFAHDSHWNSRGAALGADRINNALGRKSNYFDGEFSTAISHNGDLYEMLYPAFTDPETDPVYGGELNFTYESNATRADSVTLLTASQGDGSLLCYRDSFGNLLYPYLANSFGSCTFSRATAYDLETEAEFIVIELVERNLDYLIRYQAVYFAPEREMDAPASRGEIAVQISSEDALGGSLLVKGSLPEVPDGDSPIYILCENAVYEAACLGEADFGAYLPQGSEPVGVMYYQDGILTRWDIGQ